MSWVREKKQEGVGISGSMIRLTAKVFALEMGVGNFRGVQRGATVLCEDTIWSSLPVISCEQYQNSMCDLYQDATYNPENTVLLQVHVALNLELCKHSY